MASELSPVPADLEFEATIRRLEVTEQVFDRYKLIRILGRGGMGVVWLAHDERLERDVALKFLPDEVGLDPEAEDEMKRETRRCLDLTHPNIIRIYDYIKDRRAAAISMEFIDGKSLSVLKLERASRVFETTDLAPWVLQACQALNYAHHEAGVIHRDLKPGNLMLTSRGQIKVGDFGIAQSVSDSLARTTIRRGTSGTIAYMSPQQMSGEVAAPTDDVYALGATIYELLTGKPPFHSGNVPFQVRVMLAPPMRERRDEFEIRGAAIPQQWEDAIAECLSKSAEERPATMNELAERLGLAHAKPVAVTTASEKQDDPWPQRLAASLRQRLLDYVEAWKRPELSRRFAALAGGVVFLVALLAVVARMALAPLPAAELFVSANVPAQVHLSSGETSGTPVRFANLRPGRYTVTASADGFEPVRQTVTIGSGQHLNLSEIALPHAYGEWSLEVAPRRCHYALAGDAATGGYTSEGTTPDIVSFLPAGRYTLTVFASNYATMVQTITVLAHCRNLESVDLIPASLVQGAGDQVAKVFVGAVSASSLDPEGLSRLVALERKAFQRYLDEGLLGRAQAQLERLSALSAPISVELAALDKARAALEGRLEVEAAQLVANKKFATAKNLIAGAREDLGPEAVGRLTAQVQPALSAHDNQIANELDRLKDLPPASALENMRPLLDANPDDPRLHSFAVQRMMQLPPNPEEISHQLEALRHFAQESKYRLQDTAATLAILTLEKEQNGAKDLLRNLADAKAGLDSANAHLSHLKEQKDEFADRRVGRPQSNPFASTLNFFGKVVTGHTVVHSEPVFSSSDAKDDAIRAVETEIGTVEAALPQMQAALQQAQADYDQFAAVVPWPQA
jgi:serine/threonine protein kinase